MLVFEAACSLSAAVSIIRVKESVSAGGGVGCGAAVIKMETPWKPPARIYLDEQRQACLTPCMSARKSRPPPTPLSLVVLVAPGGWTGQGRAQGVGGRRRAIIAPAAGAGTVARKTVAAGKY